MGENNTLTAFKGCGVKIIKLDLLFGFYIDYLRQNGILAIHEQYLQIVGGTHRNIGDTEGSTGMHI